MRVTLTKLFSLADAAEIYTCCDNLLVTNSDGTVDIWTRTGSQVIRNGQISDGSLYIAQIGNDYTITDDGTTLLVYSTSEIRKVHDGNRVMFTPQYTFSKATRTFTQHRKHRDVVLARYYTGENGIELCLFNPKSGAISRASVTTDGQLVAADRSNVLWTRPGDPRHLCLWTPTGSVVLDAGDLLGVGDVTHSTHGTWYAVQQDAVIKYIGLRGHPGIIRIWFTRDGVDAEAQHTDLNIEGVMTGRDGDVALADGRMIMLDDREDVTDAFIEVIDGQRIGVVGGMDDALVVGDVIYSVEIGN